MPQQYNDIRSRRIRSASAPKTEPIDSFFNNSQMQKQNSRTKSKGKRRKHRSASPRISSNRNGGKNKRKKHRRHRSAGDENPHLTSNVDVSVLIRLLLPHLQAFQSDHDPNEELVEHSQWIIHAANKDVIKAKFRIGDCIGDGSFATVHKAVHRKSKSLVAIKEVDKTKLADGNKKFVDNEVEILANLKHKNIIRLIGAYQSSQCYWVITELSEFGDLYKAVKADGSFSANMTAGIVKDVSHALRYIHKKGIVHRDVKLENMLFMSGEHVKLADFGVACKQRGPLQRLCGTLLYVAPEIVSKKGYGKEADMYSLGVATYAMLSGHFPFFNDQQDKLIQMIVHEAPSFDFDAWKPISRSVIHFVRKLIDKDPDERYTSSTIFTSKFLKNYKEEPYTSRLKTLSM